MKNLVLFLFLIGCKANQKISTFERENIISELDYIESIDQKYAGPAFEELINMFGKEEGWKIFQEKRDSVGLDNQRRIKKLYAEYGYLGLERK